MRFMDENLNESTNHVVIILTVSEAAELRDKTKLLLTRKNVMDHEHINDNEYKKEITVSIYNTQTMEDFNSRYQKLILEDI